MSYTQTLKLSSALNLTKEGNLSDLNFDSQGEAVNKQKRGPFKQEFKIDQKEIIELQKDPFLSCRSPPSLKPEIYSHTKNNSHTLLHETGAKSHSHTFHSKTPLCKTLATCQNMSSETFFYIK